MLSVMSKNEFVTHACEQVLRFTQVNTWDDLLEERKVQLGFNMGAMALGLELSKDDGFLALANVRQGILSMKEFRNHLQTLIEKHKVAVSEENIAKPF